MKRRGVVLVLVLVAGLVAVLGLTGCEKAAEEAVEDAAGVDVDNDDGSVTIEGDDGASITMDTEAAELPEGYPDDAPVYDGKLEAAWEATQDDSTSYSLSMTTKDGVEEVVDWYKDALQDEGWTITQTYADSSNGMLNAEKGGWTFYAAVGAGGDSTDISQIVATK